MATRSAVFIMAVTIGAQDGQLICGTDNITRSEARRVQRQIEATAREHEQLRLPRPKKISIPVVFHLTNTVPHDSKVVSELARVNRAFKSRGFRFPLKSIERYSQNEPSVVDFRKNCFNGDRGWSFRSWAAVDPISTMNVYLCDPVPEENPVGYAVYPWAYWEGSRSHFITLQHIHGWPYFEHEIGHYLGLRHTFQDGCDEKNDYVPDTPAQRKSFARRCPRKRDSCRKLPGLDPVTNFMGYGESCFEEFTDGQEIRMHYMMMTYRPTLWSQSTRP